MSGSSFSEHFWMDLKDTTSKNNLEAVNGKPTHLLCEKEKSPFKVTK